VLNALFVVRKLP